MRALVQVPATSNGSVKGAANNPDLMWTKKVYLLWDFLSVFSFSDRMKIIASFLMLPSEK